MADWQQYVFQLTRVAFGSSSRNPVQLYCQRRTLVESKSFLSHVRFGRLHGFGYRPVPHNIPRRVLDSGADVNDDISVVVPPKDSLTKRLPSAFSLLPMGADFFSKLANGTESPQHENDSLGSKFDVYPHSGPYRPRSATTESPD